MASVSNHIKSSEHQKKHDSQIDTEDRGLDCTCAHLALAEEVHRTTDANALPGHDQISQLFLSCSYRPSHRNDVHSTANACRPADILVVIPLEQDWSCECTSVTLKCALRRISCHCWPAFGLLLGLPIRHHRSVVCRSIQWIGYLDSRCFARVEENIDYTVYPYWYSWTFVPAQMLSFLNDLLNSKGVKNLVWQNDILSTPSKLCGVPELFGSTKGSFWFALSWKIYISW